MKPEDKGSVIMAAAARAIIRALAMQADNQYEQAHDRRGQYGTKDFNALIEEEGLSKIQVLEFLER